MTAGIGKAKSPREQVGKNGSSPFRSDGVAVNKFVDLSDASPNRFENSCPLLPGTGRSRVLQGYPDINQSRLFISRDRVQWAVS